MAGATEAWHCAETAPASALPASPIPEPASPPVLEQAEAETEPQPEATEERSPIMTGAEFLATD
jgi:hypothetical protein